MRLPTRIRCARSSPNLEIGFDWVCFPGPPKPAFPHNYLSKSNLRHFTHFHIGFVWRDRPGAPGRPPRRNWLCLTFPAATFHAPRDRESAIANPQSRAPGPGELALFGVTGPILLGILGQLRPNSLIAQINIPLPINSQQIGTFASNHMPLSYYEPTHSLITQHITIPPGCKAKSQPSRLGMLALLHLTSPRALVRFAGSIRCWRNQWPWE